METDKYYFFWKHRLSQWHMVDFVVAGVTYCCPEQYMMAQKALLFNDTKSHDKIMATRSPKDHQSLGRTVANYNQAIWDANKYNIVLTGNRARFSQSKECRELLLTTGNKEVVEASPYDGVWGIKLGENDPRALNENTWRGENLLGKILTQVRDELKDS